MSLNIHYGAKSFKIKTTPSMSLKDVCNQAIAHFKLDPTVNYSLTKGNTAIDLLLPVRLANLPQGSSLTLVVPTGSTSLVNVKLQTGETIKNAPNGPLIKKIRNDASLKEMLQEFETHFNIELLSKSELSHRNTAVGTVQQIRTEYLPVLQIFTTVASSELDFNKKLADYGLTGSVVVRFSFQKTGEVIISETKLDLSEVDKDTQEHDLLLKEREELDEMVELEILEKKEAKYEKEDKLKGHLMESSVLDQSMEVETGNAVNTVKLFTPNTASGVSTTASESVDEKSYEMSVDQAKLYHKLVTQSGMTERMKQKLNLKKKNNSELKLKFVSVRVKFPDRRILEISFDKDSSLEKLYDTLRSDYLLDPTLDFELYQSYPRRLLLSHPNLLILNVVGPRTVLLLEPKNTRLSNLLKSDLDLESLNYEVDNNDSGDELISNQSSTPVELISEETNVEKKRSDGKKVPKWFKIGK